MKKTPALTAAQLRYVLKIMRRWFLLSLIAGVLHGAAVIRGTVVENETGHPLARALVALEAMGGGGAPQAVRCNSYGAFEFVGIAPGSYLLAAGRMAFATTYYGQKRFHSSGTPVAVADGETAAVTIRLPRFGAITGAVLDENDVGLPAYDVAVYSNTRPPKLLARAKTDDRGRYRIFGLAPGNYLVRSLARLYDEGGYVPTFFHDSQTVDYSRPVEVALDQEIEHIDIHATPGRLFTLSGRISLSYGASATVALSSDTGTEMGSLDTAGNFTFNPMPPGQYELLVQGTDRNRTAGAAFQPIALERDLGDMRIALSPLPTVQFVFQDSKGQAIDSRQLKILARRKDIAGESKAEALQVVFDTPTRPTVRAQRSGTPPPSEDTLRAVTGQVSLPPGRWEFALAPTANYFVVSFAGNGTSEPGRSDGWNDILLTAGSQNSATFVLSSSPATLTGIVKRSGEPLAGVPVFLEPYDLDPRKRLTDIFSTRTNAQGKYQFAGLAPGVYRLLGTFDYATPDPSEMGLAQAKTVKVEEGGQTTFDLDEFVIH